ncbi:MAG: Ig domain-containing protein [Synergistaceae bacterium]|nr:Ig domain-containing protein [Synergistaceae bacterium]
MSLTAYAAEVSETITFSDYKESETATGTHFKVTADDGIDEYGGITVDFENAMTIESLNGEEITRVILSYSWDDDKNTVSASPGTYDGANTVSGVNATSVTVSSTSEVGVAFNAVTIYYATANDYTITIPDTLEVKNSGWNELEGGITASGTLESGKKLVITASSDFDFNFVMSGDNTAKVPYVFTSKDSGDGKSYSDVKDGGITSWTFDTLSEDAQTQSAGIVIDDYSDKPNGYYSDTVTFTANLENAGPAVVAVTSVTINDAPSEALFVNSTGTLTAIVSSENATDKTVTWSSSEPDYVSINATTGAYEIKGTKGYGSATITATAGDKTATCTIAGKVTYTSLSTGTVLHTGDTFFTGNSVYFKAGNSNMSLPANNGVITVVEETSGSNAYYRFKRGSDGSTALASQYKKTDSTDGIYITGGSGTSKDRFTLAVHTK